MSGPAAADQAFPALDPDLTAELSAKAGLTDIQRRDLRNAGFSASEVSNRTRTRGAAGTRVARSRSWTRRVNGRCRTPYCR